MLDEALIEAVKLPAGWKYWCVSVNNEFNRRTLIDLQSPIRPDKDGVMRPPFQLYTAFQGEEALTEWKHKVALIGELFGAALEVVYSSLYTSKQTGHLHVIFEARTIGTVRKRTR